MTYGIIGLGNMGGALASALARSGLGRVIGAEYSAAVAEAATQQLGIPVGTDNSALAREADVVVVCVKPYQAEAVVEEIAEELPGKILVSVCAGVTTEDLEEWADEDIAVVRAMPNTPALVGAGMTVLCAGTSASPEQLATVKQMFDAVGRTVLLDEDQMDAATGLSGCGPAYAFTIIEALAAAGVRLGIPRNVATELAAQTMYGAAKMVLERGVHPAVLTAEVTTPGGATIEGLIALEEAGLRSALIAGVTAAADRSAELSGG